jgi:serine/threonine protein kinase
VAPEVIELKGITTAADIWSLGATVIELLTGKPPYYDMHNGMAVMYRIVDEGMEIPEFCSPGLSDFLKQCFRKNPKDRPTAEELFEHEWVKSRIELDPVSILIGTRLRSCNLIRPCAQNLRHHDSIPFLRRISTDAFKLHAERMVDDGSLPPHAQQNRPITPDVSSGLAISAAQRGSLPDFVAPSMVPNSDLPRLGNMETGPAASQGTATARVRQFTRDELNEGSIKQQVPSLRSNKSEGRARLLSLSSLSVRRRSQSGVDEAFEANVTREGLEAPAGDRGSLAEPGALPSSPGAVSWLSASALTSGLLYSGYDANKDSRNEAKSDCSVM